MWRPPGCGMQRPREGWARGGSTWWSPGPVRPGKQFAGAVWVPEGLLPAGCDLSAEGTGGEGQRIRVAAVDCLLGVGGEAVGLGWWCQQEG